MKHALESCRLGLYMYQNWYISTYFLPWVAMGIKTLWPNITVRQASAVLYSHKHMVTTGPDRITLKRQPLQEWRKLNWWQSQTYWSRLAEARDRSWWPSPGNRFCHYVGIGWSAAQVRTGGEGAVLGEACAAVEECHRQAHWIIHA